MTRLAQLIGQVLDGKYQLDSQIGQGGMGAVYLATHLGTKRPVALKIIAPQFMANTEFVERFRREAEAAGRLRHPNVVNVTDFGFAQMGPVQLAYLVMEYLDGGSLGDMLKERGRLPVALVTDILEQVCLAVGNAHKLGVIHRDLKPDNIWLQPDGRGGYIAKVLDFGLAKLRDPNELHWNDGANPGAWAGSGSKGPQTMPAGGRTTAPQSEQTALRSNEGVTGIGSSKETQFDPRRTTMPMDDGHTRLQPGADAEEPEGATLIQTTIGEDATMIQISESATLIQSAEPDEARTLIQPAATVTSEEDSATRIQSPAADVSNSTAGDEGNAENAGSVSRDGRQSALATGSTSGTSASGLSISAASAVDLTRVGAVMGTPLYMSPEQCRSEPLDPRSDIYSLGVIVYQSLTGEAPFKGDFTELMRKHVEDAPPPLLGKRADVSEPVAELINASLAKEPADRPPTAEAFASAFRATAEGEAQVLREAKATYYTSQRLFFQLSLAVYIPFAAISLGAGMALSPILSRSAAASLLFFLGLYLLVRLATRLNIAACTVASAEVRLRGPAAVKLKTILRDFRGRLPALLVTNVQTFVRVWIGLAKFILPGTRAYFDTALAPSIVATEDIRGRAALARSKRLIGPLRQIAGALLARDFGISLSALLLFPFISVVMALVFSSGTDALRFIMVPSLRNFIIVYCWFILTIMHTVYAAVPMATLYFKARQAHGEALIEPGERDWQAETKKRAGGMSRAAIFWMALPLLMLALMVVSSLTGIGTGEGSFIDAVRLGREQTVARRLAAGANPNDSRMSTTALMYAAKDGQAGVAAQLIAAGAKVNAKDNDGDTALIYAAIDNRTDVMKALLAAGADVDARNNNGNTALLAAALRDRAAAVGLLLAAGADPDVKNKKGQTARSAAEEEGHKEIVEMLRK